MLKNTLFRLISATCLLFSNLSMAQIDGVEYSWNMKRDKEEIQIYTSKVADSKYKAVRGVSIMHGELHSFVALVLDLEVCSEWADLCKSSRVVKSISSTESLVYTLNDLPFPVSDRDAIALVTWQQNPATKKVTMTSVATDSTLVPIEGAIRLKDAVTQWHFTPMNDNKVLVESFGHIDPNGSTPAWVTNQLLISSPFKSLKNMRTMINSGAYNDSQVEFLEKPSVE